MQFRYLMGTIPKRKKKSLSFDLLLVGNSGTMCSAFPSREKSGGVGVDPHLWRKNEKNERYIDILFLFTFWSGRFVLISPGNNDPAST